MALVVEDGTGVAGADSYVSVTAFRAWATGRGYLLPTDDVEVESLLRKACDFIERKQFIGETEFADQGLSFPRLVTDAEGVAVSTGIPARLKTAQYLLAMESMNGPLTKAARASQYTATKIDQIYLKYASASEGSGDLYFPAIDDLLNEWLVYQTSIYTMRA